MTSPAVTYGSESPGGAITATKWNQNFSDIINGITDGTKTLTLANIISTAATITTITPTTIAGTPNFTGNVTFAANVILGDAVGDSVTITGELKGSRMLAHLTRGVSNDNPMTDVYFTTQGSTSTETPYVMTRNGSITGYAVSDNCTGFTSNIVYLLRIKKNSVDLIVGNAITVNATGFFSDRQTFARNTYTFSAGDRLTYFLDNTTGGNAIHAITATIEFQFDT